MRFILDRFRSDKSPKRDAFSPGRPGRGRREPGAAAPADAVAALEERLGTLRAERQAHEVEAVEVRRGFGAREARLRELQERLDQQAFQSQQLRAERQEMARDSSEARVLQRALAEREAEHRSAELEEHQLQAASVKLATLKAALQAEDAHCRLAEAGGAQERRVEENLSEEEAMHEKNIAQLRTEAEELMANRGNLQDRSRTRQKSYWEAAPFLSIEESKLQHRREELSSCRRKIATLQERLRQQEVQKRAKRDAAESAATSKARTQESERQQREQSLRELLSLQRRGPPADTGVPAAKSEHAEASPSMEIEQLQAAQQRLRQEIAPLEELAERCQPAVYDSFAAVLSSASDRVLSQMKEALLTDLALTEQLEATKRQLQARCERERQLRETLEQRLAEPEADVSATIADFLRAELRSPANSDVPRRGLD